MTPFFLLSEQVIRQDGNGPALEISDSSRTTVCITLGITRVLEQQSIELSIWGSTDGENWGPKPLATFPQKFYCGAYGLILDLAAHPDIRFLRAGWKVIRWGRGEPTPLFGVYVFGEPEQVPIHSRFAVA